MAKKSKREQDDIGFMSMRAVAAKRLEGPHKRLAEIIAPEIFEFGFRCFIDGQLFAVQNFTSNKKSSKRKKRRRR